MSGIVYEELLAYVREQLAADRAAQDAADDADVIAGRAVYIAGGTVKPDYRLAKLIAQHEDNLEPLRKVLVEMTGDSAFAKYKPVGPRAARKDYARNKSVERKYLLACKLDRIREIIKQKTGRKNVPQQLLVDLAVDALGCRGSDVLDNIKHRNRFRKHPLLLKYEQT